MAENTVTCSCCDRAVETAVPLQCHAEIAICPDCIGWLRRQEERLEQERAGITPPRKRVIFVEPTFTVADVARAEAICTSTTPTRWRLTGKPRGSKSRG
jgi:hypothetical protein